jgi:hypothetical protein
VIGANPDQFDLMDRYADGKRVKDVAAIDVFRTRLIGVC